MPPGPEDSNNSPHIKVCAPGEAGKTLEALRESPATARHKAKFILATDGETIEAENLADDDEPIVCSYAEFSDHFMARLIFCFFAEDTAIFHGEGLLSSTVEQMSAGDPSKTGEVISELFRAMNLPIRHEGKISNYHRDKAGPRPWANVFQ